MAIIIIQFLKHFHHPNKILYDYLELIPTPTHGPGNQSTFCLYSSGFSGYVIYINRITLIIICYTSSFVLYSEVPKGLYLIELFIYNV